MYESQAEIDAFFKCLFQFKYVRKLGEGAFGIAILVDDEVERRKKVFKLPKNQATTEALSKEGEYLRKLSEDLLDPHIIRLHQYGKVVMEWNGQPQERFYLNMAFGGSSLRSKLGNLRIEFDANNNPRHKGGGRRLAVEEALRISIEICQGLEALHGYRGAPYRMVHRDIKPENLLIDDETGIARITDFGIVRVIDRTSALVSFAGTLIYMDPECFKGKASVQSDLYSLGVVIYEMLTGELPFYNFEQRLEGPPRLPHELSPDVPRELSACVLRTLENNIDARYESTSELLVDLRRIQARLNPLEKRYTKVSTLPDGRILCEDSQINERVGVRLVCTTASLKEFAEPLATLEELALPTIDIVRRHFRNEHMLGIVSSIARGNTLAEKFSNCGKSVDALCDLCETVAAVCDTFQAVHSVGIEHSFLSPFSIALSAHGPCIYELGNSAIFRARRMAGHSEDSLSGFDPQIPYLSPQLLKASHDPSLKDDIYSLGVILYELATGTSPEPAVDLYATTVSKENRGENSGGTDEIAESSVNPRKQNELIPSSMASIIAKAMRWNPHDRYESAKELGKALRECRWPEDTVDTLLTDALSTYPVGGTDDDLLKACSLIERVLEIDFGNVSAYRTRGIIYFRNQSYKYAIEELERVVSISPDQEAYLLLGRSYMQWQQQYTKASDSFAKALGFGEDAEVLDFYARSEMKANNDKKAISLMRRSIEMELDDSIRERRKVLLAGWKEAGRPVLEDSQEEGDLPSEIRGRRDDTLTQTPGHDN